MNKKMLPVLILPVILTGCASSLTVKASDPVVTVCNSSIIPEDLSIVDQLIDQANATNDNSAQLATPIPPREMTRIKADRVTLTQLAAMIPDPGTNYQGYFRQHLIQLAEVYGTVIASPDGLVTNVTAVSADSYTSYITQFCANLRIGS